MDRTQDALVYARAHLNAGLTLEELAGAARLSLRQFTRVFRPETDQSPARAIEALRLEAARLMIEQSATPIEAIAEDTGFVDRERMRRSFLRAFGETPRAIRMRVRGKEQ
jgi:transcriptional regulator GlxA family with amidase domain